MIDLTLPESSSPAADRFRGMPGGLRNVALYVHVQLDEAEIDELLRVCHSKHDTETVVRASRYDFTGQPLRAAYDQHLEVTAPAAELDMFYFVSVVHKNWRSKGVVLVTLDTGVEEDYCTVDQVLLPAKETALELVNLQIANTDWEDLKESNWSEDEDGEEDNAPEEVVAAYRSCSQPEDFDDYDDGAAAEPPSIGYWVGLYVVEGIECETIMRDLDAAPVRRPLEEVELRPEGRVADVDEAARLHPRRCVQNVLLCQDMFLMVDSLNYQEDGLLFVRLTEGGVRTRRLPYDRHETLTLFNMVVKEHSPFIPEPAFLVYDCGAESFESTLRSLDRSKSEKFVQVDIANSIDGPADLDQVLKIHAVMVYRHRFASLQPQYFVFTQEKLKSAKQTVTLVRTEWTGDAESLTLDERSGQSAPEGLLNVKTMPCEASRAYATLMDLVEGRQVM